MLILLYSSLHDMLICILHYRSPCLIAVISEICRLFLIFVVSDFRHGWMLLYIERV